MASISHWIEVAVGIVWSPVIYIAIGLGLFYTIRLMFIQFRCLPHAVALVAGRYDNKNEIGQITHFQALSAALSGTIGLGNIAGVAIAIALGGPGAVLWMWLVGILGMATKYAECFLGTYYRDVDDKTGEVRGGPMYYMKKGLGSGFSKLAVFYGFCLMLGAFGAGNMFQSNQAASIMNTFYNIPNWMTGLFLALLAGVVILGGIKRIGAVASKVVPFMCGTYLIGAWAICLMNIDKIPAAIGIIFTDAFTGEAALGGAVGGVILWGVRRGVFSNEAGLGSAAVAHAAVKTDYPIREGIVAALGPLIDTLIVCSATAMVIIISGNFGTERFQPVGNYTIDFEMNEVSQKGWQVTDKAVPSETETLRTYRAGDNALMFSGDAVNVRSVKLDLKMLAQINEQDAVDTIRFSSYSTGRDRRVIFVDAAGNDIASLAIKRGGDESPLASITGSLEKETWESLVITLSPELQDKLISGGVDMQFISGSVSPWFIDRVGIVKSYSDVALTSVSFDKFFTGFGSVFLAFGVLFFAYSTLITWSYYGDVAAQFVFGKWVSIPFKVVFVILTFFGSLFKLSLVLNFSDLALGLMVIPNAIAILLLSGVVDSHTKDYFKKLKSGEISRPT